MRSFLRKLASLSCLVLLLLPSASALAADVFSDACEGVTDATLCTDDVTQIEEQGNNSFFGENGILTRAAGLIGVIVGVASIIMIIIGGFKYVLAAGDSGKIASARDTIIYAVVGIVLSLSTQGIVLFVLSRL